MTIDTDNYKQQTLDVGTPSFEAAEIGVLRTLTCVFCGEVIKPWWQSRKATYVEAGTGFGQSSLYSHEECHIRHMRDEQPMPKETKVEQVVMDLEPLQPVLVALDRTFMDWRDDSKVPLIVKIGEAAAAFTAKFGVPPNALVLSLEDGDKLIGNVILGMDTRCSTYIRPNIIRVGIEA